MSIDPTPTMAALATGLLDDTLWKEQQTREWAAAKEMTKNWPILKTTMDKMTNFVNRMGNKHKNHRNVKALYTLWLSQRLKEGLDTTEEQKARYKAILKQTYRG